MHGVNRLYEVIYNASPREKEAFFSAVVTRTEPLEITAFDLPIPSPRIARGLGELLFGDEVLGVFIGDAAYIFAVM